LPVELEKIHRAEEKVVLATSALAAALRTMMPTNCKGVRAHCKGDPWGTFQHCYGLQGFLMDQSKMGLEPRMRLH
jgi:hypothetical protein